MNNLCKKSLSVDITVVFLKAFFLAICDLGFFQLSILPTTVISCVGVKINFRTSC